MCIPSLRRWNQTPRTISERSGEDLRKNPRSGILGGSSPLRRFYPRKVCKVFTLFTILQAHTRNVLLHVSYASRSSLSRLTPGPIRRIFRIMDANFGEFLFHALRCISLPPVRQWSSAGIIRLRNESFEQGGTQ
jgi:hypothetical protein